MLIEAPSLAATPDIRHGFFTREGGVSTGLYASLNCGVGSRDKAEHVAENRRRVAARLGAPDNGLVTPYQIHSADVAVAETPWTREAAPQADAVVTARPGLAIGVSTADCVPVLLADADARVVGAAHAGWRGALAGVLEAAIEAMEGLGAARRHIAAAVGPAISQESYEVGADFEETFVAADGANARFFKRPAPGAKPHFDLTGYVSDRLRRAGLTQIEAVTPCTYASGSRFFSYRRSVHQGEADYGRQISAIVIA